MADFTMPALGADMESGQVVQWLVQPGSRVKPGDVVAVVETHKGAIDVECFLDGVIDDLVPLGTSWPVGAVLAHVRLADEAPVAPAGPTTPVTRSGPGRTRVSPAARQRALAGGLDLDTLKGHGADGAVVLADVERALATAKVPIAHTARTGGFDPAQMRQAIAAAMARSKREIPHYYLEESIDFGPATDWIEAFNRDRPPTERLLPAVLMLKAVALALKAVPQLNGFCVGGQFDQAPDVHVGWAIALRGGGLVAPAIRHADRLDLPNLMTALRDLVQRARAGGLRSSELTDPTVTVTSLGDRGAERVQGVIYPPQVAIVGFGRVVQRPWVVDGSLTVRPVVHCSLAADHRTSDGHLGSVLMAAIAQNLQSPETLNLWCTP